jgi:hypothetical protein
MNLKSDPTLLEKIAGEYNRLNVDEYDAIQYPQFAHKICSKNFPDKFSPIDWKDAKKAWNQCVKSLPLVMATRLYEERV